jgi:hypothetical protein
MSSWSPKRAHRSGTAAALGIGLLALAAAATAAEWSNQPAASVGADYNSNINYIPGPKQSATGYYAQASTIVGIDTPLSSTVIRPRLEYDYYPDLRELDQLEEYLDFNTTYRGERNHFSMLGAYDRRNDLNAETDEAVYNNINPGLQNTPSSGRVVVGTVRSNLIVLPKYSYNLTPLSSVGGSVEYERMTYSPTDTTSHIDFNYYQGNLFYNKVIDQRNDFTINGLYSTYQAQNIDTRDHTYGGGVNYGHNWSPIFRSEFGVVYYETEVNQTTPKVVDNKANDWGFTFNTIYTGETDQLRVDIGRTIQPSSAGGLYNTDQVRGQYDRSITERFQFTLALRYLRTRSVGGAVLNDERDYATGQFFLKYMLTQFLYVRGGYTYIWQKYQVYTSSTDNNQVMIEFGYRGLGRQR